MAQKQPHEMTARQLVKAVGPTVETKKQSDIEPWMITKEQTFEYICLMNKQDKGWKNPNGPSRECSDNIHRRIIEKAFQEGKPIPKVVLEEYPDLVLRGSTQRSIP